MLLTNLTVLLSTEIKMVVEARSLHPFINSNKTCLGLAAFGKGMQLISGPSYADLVTLR